ncbi:hypothetical protein ACJX0J_028740 [Zea mays]
MIVHTIIERREDREEKKELKSIGILPQVEITCQAVAPFTFCWLIVLVFPHLVRQQLPFLILRPNSTDYTIYPFPYSTWTFGFKCKHVIHVIFKFSCRNEPVQMKVSQLCVSSRGKIFLKNPCFPCFLKTFSLLQSFRLQT